MEDELGQLPENVKRALSDFVGATKEACGGNLQSIVLFGSAAEGRLRPSSDVNLMLVLKDFEISQVNQLREMLRVSYAAIRLKVMFILDSEIATASETFALKFNDILSRHRLLFGSNPFREIEIPRSATVQWLRQAIFNLILRLRERYALVGLREDQLVPIIADVTGPIRVSAAVLLALEGKKDLSPKDALQIFTKQLPGNNWSRILESMSAAREEQELKPHEAASTLLGILDLLKAMQLHIQSIK